MKVSISHYKTNAMNKDWESISNLPPATHLNTMDELKRKFQTLYGRVKSILNNAGIPLGMRKGLWTEAGKTAVISDNAAVLKADQKPAHLVFFNTDSPYVHVPHHFREMGTCLDPTKQKVKGKLVIKGPLCTMSGAAVDHSKDTCRILNIQTKKVIITRYILWLNKTYGSYFNKVLQEFDVHDMPNVTDHLDVVDDNHGRVHAVSLGTGICVCCLCRLCL
jgi:hypothetical protein